MAPTCLLMCFFAFRSLCSMCDVPTCFYTVVTCVRVIDKSDADKDISCTDRLHPS